MQKVLLAVIAAAVVAVGLSVNFATATHQPADKAQAAASDIDRIDETEDGDGDLILKETMKVSSVSDLILQTSAECSILTSLYTAGGNNVASEHDGSFGQVKLWLEIDGKRVPVSTNDQAVNEQGDEDDLGEVVFCNRAYQRTVTDQEQDEDGNNDDVAGAVRDGLDSEDDFIRTRTANAFNWMAFDVGNVYDDAVTVNGNNIVEIKLFAEYDRKTSTLTGAESEENQPAIGDADCGARRPDDDLDPYGATCADAFVGSRSLIIEAVHASNHEQASQEEDNTEGDDQLPVPELP